MSKGRETLVDDAAVTNALLDIMRATRTAKVSWALVGGQALRAYGVPRETLDADALISRDGIDDVAELLVDVFGWQPLVYDNDTDDYTEANVVMTHEMDDPVLFDVHERREMIPLLSPLGLLVELLSAQHPIETDMVDSAALRKHCGVVVPIAPLGGVLLVKTKADRPKDVAAIEQTAEHLSDASLRVAIDWAQKRDSATTDELRNILGLARARRAPVRTVARRSKPSRG